MSYDFNTRSGPCPHLITGERYIVDTVDFKTLHLAADTALNMRAPINGLSQVIVRISGEEVQQNDPVYGYSIVADENRLLTQDQFRKIVFNLPVRWFIPLIEVEYITLQPYCLRCSATGQLNDFKLSGSGVGSFSRVTNTDELVQKVLKFVLTSRCAFYPQFTCAIRDYIGKKFGTVVTSDDISMQIMDALQSLKNIQSAQATVQTLSLLERLKDITGISTTMPDPTSVAVAASVTSYGTQSSPLPINFSISSTRNLVGS